MSSHNILSEFSEIQGLSFLEKKGRFSYFSCEPSEFENLCFYIQSNYGYIWLLDIVCRYIESTDLCEFRYYFNYTEANSFFCFTYVLPADSQVKSVAHMWKNASAYEEEISEMFGVCFSRQYSARVFSEKNKNYPMKLSKDSKKTPRCRESNKEKRVELVSLGVDKDVQLSLKSSDIGIIDSGELFSGEFHIGIEKFLEERRVHDFFSVTEGYFSKDSVVWSTLGAMNVEESLDVTIPERAQALRMILLEFNRIINHCDSLRRLGLYERNDYLFKNSFLWIRRIQSIITSFSGRGNGELCIRPGGMSLDIDQSWPSEVLGEISLIKKELEYFYHRIFKKESWKSALDIDLLNKERAILWSITGPLLRSSGINLDFRVRDPFYFYSDVEFKVPIGAYGKVYDLYLVRIEEIFESFSIIIQLLDNLPLGSTASTRFKSILRDKDKLEYHDAFEYTSSYGSLPDLDQFHFYEGASGLYGLGQKIEQGLGRRIKFITQALSQRNLFEEVIRGQDIEDVDLIWNSMNIDLKEAER